MSENLKCKLEDVIDKQKINYLHMKMIVTDTEYAKANIRLEELINLVDENHQRQTL